MQFEQFGVQGTNVCVRVVTLWFRPNGPSNIKLERITMQPMQKALVAKIANILALSLTSDV